MSFLKFLKDHLAHLLAFVLGMGFLNLVIWIDSGFHVRTGSMFYLDLLGVVFFIAFLMLLYWSRKTFFQELRYRTRHPEKSYEEKLELAENETDKIYEQAYNALLNYNRQINNELVEKITDQQDFITKWIHEIKVPITALQLLIESVQDKIEPEKVTQINEEIKKTDHLIEQILYYSRLDDFSNDYLIQKYSLKKVTKDVVIENMNYLLAKKLTFTLEGEDEEVLTDDKWLKFIITQLISNAIKYTPENGKLAIKIMRNNNQVFLKFTDSGIGIPSDDLPRIFEKGFTGQNGRKQNTKSTGLGLFLAKQMATKLGHQLNVLSEVGEGTTFTLVFPFLGFYNEKGKTDNLTV